MNNLRGFKQKLALVARLWDARDYDAALAQVDALRERWPGNAHLHVLWASLVQLQEEPRHDLDEVKQALQSAVEFDKGSPAAAIELGHYFDTVEDDPAAATRAYADGVAAARHLLIDGLIGQAKVYRHLEKRKDFQRAILEILHLLRFEQGTARAKADDFSDDIIYESAPGHFFALQLKGPFAEQIYDLLSDGLVKPAL